MAMTVAITRLDRKRPPDAPRCWLAVGLCGKPLIEPEADTLDVPGQEFCDAVDGMIGDVLDQVPQIDFRFEAVLFGGFDQAVDCCCTQPTCIRTSKCPIAPAEGDRSHGTLCR